MSLFKGNAFVRHLLITIILSCVSSDSFAGTCGATRPTGSIRSTVVSENASVMLAKSSLGGRNLFFIENRGQLKDQSGNPRGDIDFKMSGGKGLNVFVGRGGLHYQWSASLGDRTYKSRLCRMDVELTGANKNAQLHVEDIQDYCERYYTSSSGSDSVVLAHSYKKISYRNIYKDIDWVLYVKDGKLEYDFIVQTHMVPVWSTMKSPTANVPDVGAPLAVPPTYRVAVVAPVRPVEAKSEALFSPVHVAVVPETAPVNVAPDRGASCESKLASTV